MSEPTYNTMIYKEYPVTLTVSCGLPDDNNSKEELMKKIAEKIYGSYQGVGGGICQFTVGDITTVGGFLCKGAIGTYNSGYLFIIAQQQSGEGESASVTTDLKAWKYLDNCINDAVYFCQGTRFGIIVHDELVLGVANTGSSGSNDGYFYVPRKSFMLEGRHEDIIKGQTTTQYPATKVYINTGLN